MAKGIDVRCDVCYDKGIANGNIYDNNKLHK